MNPYIEAREIAAEALRDSEGDFDLARDWIHEACDGHEVAIYYHKGIQFCADHDTSDGEQWLEDCGGIVQPGDTFGQIACRIAFATLLVRSEEALQELQDAAENA